MLKKIRVKRPFGSLIKKKKVGINKEVDHRQAEQSHRQSLLMKKGGSGSSDHQGEEEDPRINLNKKKIPTGFFAVYVGEGRKRFVVPTNFLSHPLFKILLEKTYHEFGFEQKYGLIVPCTVSTFQQVVTAVQSNHRRFDISRILFDDDFL